MYMFKRSNVTPAEWRPGRHAMTGQRLGVRVQQGSLDPLKGVRTNNFSLADLVQSKLLLLLRQTCRVLALYVLPVCAAKPHFARTCDRLAVERTPARVPTDKDCSCKGRKDGSGGGGPSPRA